MNGNILSSVVIQINYRYKDELIMEIKEKTNEKAPEKVVNKTTETLVKELETMSDTKWRDNFCYATSLYLPRTLPRNRAYECFLSPFYYLKYC